MGLAKNSEKHSRIAKKQVPEPQGWVSGFASASFLLLKGDNDRQIAGAGLHQPM